MATDSMILFALMKGTQFMLITSASGHQFDHVLIGDFGYVPDGHGACA